ncbi:uncharacterized protein [Ranitomeya imitator]|uniref:uncharacterized protein n=1 Tax=Ranitomeya imitator TaxID=111125 RepID=UPI0037E815D4
MKDRFNKDLRQEIQVRSGAAARIGKNKYHRLLEFLRPVLAQGTTWSSTLETGSSSGVVPHRTATDQSQPSTSEAASGSTSRSEEQAAGPSDVPFSQSSASFWGSSSHKRQKALDRSLMPKFLHLSSVFQNGLKVMGERLESGLTHINTQDVNQHLNRLEADLRRPAHHFFNQLVQGISEHLTLELQLNVIQACNAAYVQAMQQTRYLQQPQVVHTLHNYTVYLNTEFCCIPLYGHHHAPSCSTPLHRHHHAGCC